VNIRSHHRQNPSIAGSRAGSSTVVTDPQPRSAAITARFLGTNADLTPAAINDSGAFSRSFKVVFIAALYTFTSAAQYPQPASLVYSGLNLTNVWSRVLPRLLDPLRVVKLVPSQVPCTPDLGVSLKAIPGAHLGSCHPPEAKMWHPIKSGCSSSAFEERCLERFNAKSDRGNKWQSYP
jgi:hypothetical protein